MSIKSTKAEGIKEGKKEVRSERSSKFKK